MYSLNKEEIKQITWLRNSLEALVISDSVDMEVFHIACRTKLKYSPIIVRKEPVILTIHQVVEHIFEHILHPVYSEYLYSAQLRNNLVKQINLYTLDVAYGQSYTCNTWLINATNWVKLLPESELRTILLDDLNNVGKYLSSVLINNRNFFNKNLKDNHQVCVAKRLLSILFADKETIIQYSQCFNLISSILDTEEIVDKEWLSYYNDFLVDALSIYAQDPSEDTLLLIAHQTRYSLNEGKYVDIPYMFNRVYGHFISEITHRYPETETDYIQLVHLLKCMMEERKMLNQKHRN